MHRELAMACEELGVVAPTLHAAARRSDQWIDDARTFLGEKLSDVEEGTIDVVLFGSIGRREASLESDLDYLVIAHRLIRHSASTVPRVMSAVAELREDLGLREPGGTGLFGRLVAAPDLVERIGLDEDTNAHHTRRALLLLESVSAFAPDMHHELLGSIVDRYLADYDKAKAGVPRFLLNDVLRYWRTMTVDYQAKKWGAAGPGWGLRYLKLILSRKLMVAGTVMSILRCDEATEAYFLEQFSMPPLARLASARTQLAPERQDALRVVLTTAEEFAAALEDDTFRAEVAAVTRRTDIEPDSRFQRFRVLARDLQSRLEEIFFDDFLGARARTYLSF